MGSRGTYNYNRYGDNLARKRRRRFFLKISVAISAIVILAGSSVYFLFFSPYLKIKNIEIRGLETVSSTEILSIIDSLRQQGYFVKIKPGDNILFFNAETLRDRIASEFPVVKEISVSKEFPHKLKVTIDERSPKGTWCSGDICRYFDESGILWGKAVRSYGSLLLTIEDLRAKETGAKIDITFLDSVEKAVIGLKGIGMDVRNIDIQPEDIGDFRANIQDRYPVLFNEQTDINGQINILGILLKEKGDDFKPEYIDLRIDGRIYYK